jgi:hypothetical protein
MSSAADISDVRRELLRIAGEALVLQDAGEGLIAEIRDDGPLDLLAVSWRSQRMVDELHKLDGLGRPAVWLETLHEELAEGLAAPA